MSRLGLMDTGMNVIVKMSDGNPGALSCLMGLKDHLQNDTKWMMTILSCDTLELYGSQLYMLWSDCCNRDFSKMMQVLDGWKEGKIKTSDIDERVKNVGFGKPFDDLLEEVTADE